MSGVALPKYLELSSNLRSRIATGEFRSGEQIPSEQELASRYQVSRNTVRQAMAVLEEENYVVRRRGAGTFVKAINEAGQPRRKLESVVLLIVGSGTPSGYNMRSIAAAERWAAERGISMAVASLVTEDLLKGRRPALLEKNIAQAILFDGWVTDLHCLVAEELGVPYLVVGNHPVSPGRPQVRLDIDAMMDRMVEHLQIKAEEQPIAMLIEPLALHISREMLVAYTERTHQLPQRLPWIELVKNHQVHEGIERLLEISDEPFSLIATGGHLPAIVETYRRRKIDPRKYPIVALVHSCELSQLDDTACALMPFDGDSIIAQALSEFAVAYEQSEMEELYLSLCPKAILPPKACT